MVQRILLSLGPLKALLASGVGKFFTAASERCSLLQVQIAALEVLPLIPPHKLANLMTPEASFPGLVTRQMSTSVKEVSATAVAAVGRWLSDTLATDVLANVPRISSTAKNWAAIIAEATLDSSQALAAAAFDAARQDLLIKPMIVPIHFCEELERTGHIPLRYSCHQPSSQEAATVKLCI